MVAILLDISTFFFRVLLRDKDSIILIYAEREGQSSSLSDKPCVGLSFMQVSLAVVP